MLEVPLLAVSRPNRRTSQNDPLQTLGLLRSRRSKNKIGGMLQRVLTLTTWNTRLPDHLICAHEQRIRNRDIKRFGRLEVDDQIDLRYLLDRHVGRLFALENPAGVNTG